MKNRAMSPEKEKFLKFIEEQKKIPYVYIFPIVLIIITIKSLLWCVFIFNNNQFNLLWEIPFCIIAGLIGAYFSTIATIFICFSISMIVIILLHTFTFFAKITENTQALLILHDAGIFTSRCVEWFLQGHERPF